MRGSKKIYTELLSLTTDKRRKGRCSKLNDAKANCIIDRYLFYLLMSELRFEAIISKVGNDFFLSPVTIGNIINQQYTVLMQQKKEYSNTDKGALKRNMAKKWPQYTWDFNGKSEI